MVPDALREHGLTVHTLASIYGEARAQELPDSEAIASFSAAEDRGRSCTASIELACAHSGSRQPCHLSAVRGQRSLTRRVEEAATFY